MEFDPKLLELRKKRAERYRILGPLLQAAGPWTPYGWEQYKGFHELIRGMMGTVGEQAYDPLRHSDYYR